MRDGVRRLHERHPPRSISDALDVLPGKGCREHGYGGEPEGEEPEALSTDVQDPMRWAVETAERERSVVARQWDGTTWV